MRAVGRAPHTAGRARGARGRLPRAAAAAPAAPEGAAGKSDDYSTSMQEAMCSVL